MPAVVLVNAAFPMAQNNVRATLSTEEMAKALKVSERTLLGLRRKPDSPFLLGRHYRFRGITSNAPLQWFPEATDEAFTQFQADRWKGIETMDGAK